MSSGAFFQAVTPSILTSAVTASSHFFLGLSLFFFPPPPSSHVYATDMLQLTTLSFVPLYGALYWCTCINLVSPYLFFDPFFLLFVPLNIFLSIFLFHASTFISFFHTYTTVGLSTVLHILIFAVLEILLDLRILFNEPIVLLPLLIPLSISSSSSLSQETVIPGYSKWLDPLEVIDISLYLEFAQKMQLMSLCSLLNKFGNNDYYIMVLTPF
jgi:hypothetical protein